MIALSHYQDESNLTLFREIYSNIAETIDIRKTAVRAIIINSKAQAAQLLVDMLENENNIELCKVAIYVAGNLEIHETVNVLLQFIKSSKRDVVYEALRAIEKIKDPLSIEALLAQFDEEEEPTFLKVYCKIFRNLKARDALEPMIIKMANLEAEGVNYFSEKIEGILEPETLKEYIEKMKGPRNVRLRNGIQRLKQFVASQKDGEYPKFPIPDL
jgi:HEAT repeat protein